MIVVPAGVPELSRNVEGALWLRRYGCSSRGLHGTHAQNSGVNFDFSIHFPF